MTKRWSGTASGDGKTKLQASKEDRAVAAMALEEYLRDGGYSIGEVMAELFIQTPLAETPHEGKGADTSGGPEGKLGRER